MSLSPLDARNSIAAASLPGLDEVRRICALPLERRMEPAEVDEVSREEVAPAAYRDGFRLWRQQAEAAMAFRTVGGLFAPLRVAGGKTIIAYLCAKHALQRLGLARVLLLVPSDLVSKAARRDVPLMRRTVDFRAPVHVVGGMPPARRLALSRSGWRGLYVYPYSLLREDQADEELGLIDPDAVVADEAHSLRGVRTAAGTKRFMRMMGDRPASRRRLFAGGSGTMAKRSLKDYAHLLLLALPDDCPVPREPSGVDRWASALDEVGQSWREDDSLSDMVGLEPLRAWALDRAAEGAFSADEVGGPLTPDAEGYRRAFRLRRNATQGVVASAEDDLGTSLVMHNLPAQAPMSEAEVQALEDDLERRFPGDEPFVPSEAFSGEPPFRKLLCLLWSVRGITDRRASRGRMTTPSGDPIEDARQAYHRAYELCSGFYHEMVWPAVGRLAAERGIPEVEAREILARAGEHLQAHRRWQRDVREFLEDGHVPGLDTPVLVWNGCQRDDPRLPAKMRRHWLGARALDFEGRPDRESRAVRVCDWKIRAAAAWARKIPEGRGALVWTFHREVGEWAAEVLSAELGPDRVIHCPSGRKHDEVIQSPRAGRSIVVAALGGSSGGHSRGKDLQHLFSENYFLQWPRSADLAEQAIGRTHRPGQPADELRVHTCNSLIFDHMNFCACLSDALWTHQVEGEQKIIGADYVEEPRLFPPEFLSQRGFDLLAKRDVSAALRAILSPTAT